MSVLLNRPQQPNKLGDQKRELCTISQSSRRLIKEVTLTTASPCNDI
jgi:hypothetical protein